MRTSNFQGDLDLLEWARTAADPDQSVALFERWVMACGNPHTWLESIAGEPELGRRFLYVLGSSDHIGQILVQNPELAHVVLDPDEHDAAITQEDIQQHIQSLLGTARSYLHELDRLRYAKQYWTIRCVVRDLFHLDPQPIIWQTLSELADCLIAAALDCSWREFCLERSLGENTCPIDVVAFGKLGGNEINYSSDVDLVYIQREGIAEPVAKQLERFCHKFTKSLSDSTGRGALYRVDLRLRPYGGAGSVHVSWRAVESYYDRYAEDWEILALIRSRMIVGDETRWEQLRRRTCFQVNRGEWFIENVLTMRKQIEGFSEPADIKRGAGGIRDIEFLAQLLQISSIATHPELDCRPTLDVLYRIGSAGLLAPLEISHLAASYEWLRMLEHRLQLQSNLQTHLLPDDPARRDCIATVMHLPSGRDLELELAQHRHQVRSIWLRHLGDEALHPEFIVVPATAEPWLNSLRDGEAVRASLRSNVLAHEIVVAISDHAPAAFNLILGDDELAEQIVSAEVEEEQSGRPLVNATDLRRAVARELIRVARHPAETSSHRLARLYQSWLQQQLKDRGIEVIALGSFAMGECVLGSDLDLLLLADSETATERSEEYAQEFLRKTHEYRRDRAPIEVDLRLRPEGAAGLLVRSLAGFRQYARTEMEPWERIALQRNAPILASETTLAAIRDACFGVTMGQANLAELQAIKHRVETERLSTETVWRDVKLGFGGMMDIEWATQLHVWHGANCGHEPPSDTTDRRLDWLAESARVASREEVDLLKQAHAHHRRIRELNSRFGTDLNLVPENPDKLARLAREFAETDPDAWLLRNMEMRKSVRSLYQSLIDRLNL